MNRLIFSEGGQPVFLEDLKMLQDNMIDLILSLFPKTDGLTGDDALIKSIDSMSVFATARHINTYPDANSEWVQAHKLITKNGIYDVSRKIVAEGGTRRGSGKVLDCYYVLREETVENREFEDGVERPVVKSYTADIVEEKPQSGTFFKVRDVPSLDSLQALLPSKYTDYLKLEE